MPKRIQRKRSRGWKLPEGAICVTRPGRWGNPFPVEKFGRERALTLCRMWLNGEWRPEMHPYAGEHERRHGRPSRETIVNLLGGHDLACWCREGDACHADILLEIANT